MAMEGGSLGITPGTESLTVEAVAFTVAGLCVEVDFLNEGDRGAFPLPLAWFL